MKRPDLTHLTQAQFTVEDKFNLFQINIQNESTIFAPSEYKKVLLNIPKLVQALEMLHDSTLDSPYGFTHLFTKDLLNQLV